jgi:hypothetical protein
MIYECDRNESSQQRDDTISEIKTENLLEEKDIYDFSNYSLNLMWINERRNIHQKYIAPESSMKQLKEWILVLGKEQFMQLWYDSHLIDSTSLEETRDFLLKGVSKDHPLPKIVFRDVRKLKEVQEHPHAFSDKLPVRFRSDLLRVIAAYRSLMDHENEYFVYADLDIKPISEEEIFDEKTKKKLKKFSIVMARDYAYDIENSFQITGQNHNLLQAMKKVLIDASIEQAEACYELISTKHVSWDSSFLSEQAVYHHYKTMFYYFYELQEWGKLVDKLNPKSAVTALEVSQLNEAMKHYSFRFDPKEKVLSNKFYFDELHGAMKKFNGIVFPTKKVKRNVSRWGGSSKRPDEYISVKKYSQSLTEALKHPEEFDNVFLHLAVKNNFIESVQQIIDGLDDELDDEFSAQAVAEAFSSKSTSYNGEQLSAFSLAVQEGRREIIEMLMESLSDHSYLIRHLVHTLEESSFLKKYEEEITDERVDFLKWFMQKISHDEVLLASFSESLLKKNHSKTNFFENSIRKNHLSIVQAIADRFQPYVALFSKFMFSPQDLEKKKFFGTQGEMRIFLHEKFLKKNTVCKEDQEEDQESR